MGAGKTGNGGVRETGKEGIKELRNSLEGSRMHWRYLERHLSKGPLKEEKGLT